MVDEGRAELESRTQVPEGVRLVGWVQGDHATYRVQALLGENGAIKDGNCTFGGFARDGPRAGSTSWHCAWREVTVSTNPRADPLEALRGAGASDLVKNPARSFRRSPPMSAQPYAARRCPRSRRELRPASTGCRTPGHKEDGLAPSSSTMPSGGGWTGRAALRADRLAAVGIGLKKDVEFLPLQRAGQQLQHYTWYYEPAVLSYQAGLLLLTRDEPWRDASSTGHRMASCGLASPTKGPSSCRYAFSGGRGPQERVLAAAARHARRVCFWLWATDNTARVFPWDMEVGQRAGWAALELPLNSARC